ncbi:Ribonuclease H-like superfamily [Sesbania bispinosa]|nr:Ribonuclease H-like superfamily [Sesbania bispinosa]
MIMDGLLWRVGDGRSINIWEDKWLPSSTDNRVNSQPLDNCELKFASDLMKVDRKAWNRELIFESFPPAVAKQILAIPLTQSSQQDILTWKWTLSKKYSVRSGYRLIMETQVASVGSSYSPPFPWSTLWSANCIPRCKDLAWRACHDILPVLTVLQKKKLQVDHICPMCGGAPETAEHALIYCSQVAPIWFASQLGIAINENNNLSVQCWLQRFLNLNDKDASGLILTTMWAIWKRRNLWVFEKKLLKFSQVLDMVTMNTPAPQPIGSSSRYNQPRPASWVRPEETIYKANVNAAISPNSGAGLGVVFRNSQGEVMATATSSIPNISDSTLAEALAIQWAMKIAQQLLLTRVTFEADNQLCIQRLNSNITYFSYLSSIIEDCRSLQANFSLCKYSFTPRTNNRVADRLSKLAFSYGEHYWVEDYPPELALLLSDDVVQSVLV